MKTPYESRVEPEPQFANLPKRWWLPLLIGVIVTPPAIGLAVLSHGFGHGNGFADDILFPLHRPVRILLGSENIADIFTYFGQFVSYGIVLALAARQRQFLVVTSVLIAFHLISYLLRHDIADLLISVRD